jgi:excisionase family DNA binding protein
MMPFGSGVQDPNPEEATVAQATARLSSKGKRALADAVAAAGRPLHDIPGAAGQLGCSEMHIYRLIAAGQLRAVDISIPGSRRSKTRIRADDLASYIERQTR